MFGSFISATHCLDSPGENSVDSYHEPRFHVYPNRTGNGDVALCPYFLENDENRDIGLRPHFQKMYYLRVSWAGSGEDFMRSRPRFMAPACVLAALLMSAVLDAGCNFNAAPQKSSKEDLPCPS